MVPKLLKLFLLFFVLLALSVPVTFSSCTGEETEPTVKSGLGIYLEDTGELVLSAEHFEGYYRNYNRTIVIEDTHFIELNEAGIEKWNSYMTYEEIPKLKDTLYQRDFVLKINGKEMYEGKFYSLVSSASYDGVVILDALIELDGDKNRIYISHGYPGPDFASGEDPRNSPEIMDFLAEHNLLK